MLGKGHGGQGTDKNVVRTFTYMSILLLCNRILRSWNQTGIKWADQPDIGDWLLHPENKTLLSLLTLVSLVGITLSIYYKFKRNRCDFFNFAVFTAGAVGVYLFRATTDCVGLWSMGEPQTGIHYAQFVHLCVIVLVFKSCLQSCHEGRGSTQYPHAADTLVTGYLLLITLLSRTHNIPLVVLTLLQVNIHRNVVWKRCGIVGINYIFLFALLINPNTEQKLSFSIFLQTYSIFSMRSIIYT